ncbi:MAG: flagellar biosynthetic protein FliO [Burkholderiales bacterium]|nr:flagellar biosynthetic protein FliO [Burkholderiales bacterium]
MSAFLQALAALALVLAAIGAAAWLARRLQGMGAAARGAPLALRGALAVGPRERVVLVEVEGVRLVLGVAPGRVSALATLPASAPQQAPLAPAELVQKWSS